MATTPAFSKLNPVARNQGQPIQQFIPAATWVDVVATSGTAANYTVPTGAVFLRLTPTSAAGATYGNFNNTAVVPAGGHTDGSGSFPIISQTTLVAPAAGSTLSLVSASGGFVTIEVWN